ncbi:MAG TPA: hypothetical protein VG738_11195 [Chitinophagaceae bacterium]|nr:hypothetical protein [Chitinophagaceae bacterium]
MSKERKIEAVVRKLSFAAAEDADDRYWADASEKVRFNELVRLRWMVFGMDEKRPLKIAKVVKRRKLYEENNESSRRLVRVYTTVQQT